MSLEYHALNKLLDHLDRELRNLKWLVFANFIALLIVLYLLGSRP